MRKFSRETKSPVKISLSKMKVENIRVWGACWLGLYLWDLVGLDSFWTERLSPKIDGKTIDEAML